MQPAHKAGVSKTTAGHRLAAKSTKQAAVGSIHHHAKKGALRTVPGGWVGLQNLHDVIVFGGYHTYTIYIYILFQTLVS